MGLSSVGEGGTVGTYLVGTGVSLPTGERHRRWSTLQCQVGRGSQGRVPEETITASFKHHYPGHADNHVMCGRMRKQALLFFCNLFGDRTPAAEADLELLTLPSAGTRQVFHGYFILFRQGLV